MDKLTAYKILGLKRGSDFEAVREAYRALVEVVHPEDDPERFSEIQNAYRYLLRLNNSENVKGRKDARPGTSSNVQFDIPHEGIYSTDDIKSAGITLEAGEEGSFHSFVNTVSTNEEDGNELGELFEDASEKSEEVHNAELQYENDMEAINAIRTGTLHVKAFQPDYLAYLLKTYPLTKKEYKKIYAQFSGMKEEDKNKLRTDITRPRNLLINTALCFFAAMLVVIFIMMYIIKIDMSSSSGMSITYFSAVISTGTIMFNSYRKAKERKKSESSENSEKLLTEMYSESIAVIHEITGVVPESKREIYISAAVAAVNIIPFILSDFTYGALYSAILNIALFFLYYAFRKQMPKRSCGFIELSCELMFQFISFMTLYHWDFRKYIALAFLVSNLALIIYKLVKR